MVSSRGLGDVYKRQEPKDAPNLATMGWREVQSWKRALDRKILATEAKPGGAASDEYLAAIRQRDEIDNLLYEHAGEPWAKAQATYARRMKERDAFVKGRKVSRTLEAPEVDELLADPNAAEVAKGVGSVLQKDLDAVREGKNPAALLYGSGKTEARVRAAVKGDEAAQGRITKVGQNIDRRFSTANTVGGGSPTARNLADDGDLVPSLGGARSVRSFLVNAALDLSLIHI